MTSGPFPEQLTYTKHEVVSLKGHTQFNEKWVQEQIAEEPQILGLGELRLVATEKPIPGGGRLDLLLIDDEGNRRYEMELMLGAVDESHIIRTLEYWDVERRRFPHYDHCAVIVAEEITSRFINVIQLFNRTVPLIAIQMKALKVDSQILLTFTKVLDEFEIGPTEDEEPEQPADRAYWEKLGSVATLKLTDRCLELVHEIEPGSILALQPTLHRPDGEQSSRSFRDVQTKEEMAGSDRSDDRQREGREGDRGSWLCASALFERQGERQIPNTHE